MHIHSTAQIVEATAAAMANSPAAMPADTMAALEAQAVLDKGTRLPGFVSAGVIQQGQDSEQQGAAAAGATADGQLAAPAAGKLVIAAIVSLASHGVQ